MFHTTSFTVYINQNSLIDVLLSAKLSAVGHRWVAELQILILKSSIGRVHRNIDADMQPRLPLDPSEYMKNCTTEMGKNGICATIQAVIHQGEDITPWVAAVSASMEIVSQNQPSQI